VSEIENDHIAQAAAEEQARNAQNAETRKRGRFAADEETETKKAQGFRTR
jgi:hypothetical protein